MAEILFLDANSVKYAYEAAGNSTALLDRYAAYAKAAGYDLAITDVVRREFLADIVGEKDLADWLVICRSSRDCGDQTPVITL